MEVLSSFIRLAPYIPKLLGNEKLAIWATDEDKYIFMEDRWGFVGIRAGDPLSEDGTPRMVMRSQEAVDRIVPRSVYGITFRSVCIPVEGGTIGVSLDIEDTRKVLDFIERLSAVAQEVTATSSEIAHQASEIDRTVEDVVREVKEANEKREQLEHIAKMLEDITSQLQLLSLNAMIEAARSLDNGSVFSVVAHEIKKLSEDASGRLKEVKSIVKQVSGLLERIDGQMDIVLDLATRQSLSTEDISTGIQNVAVDVETLQKLANKL